MEKVIEEHIRAFGDKREKDITTDKGQYAESTIKNYISNIRNLHRIVRGKGTPFDDLDWGRDYDGVVGKIKDLPNPQTKRNYVNALIVSLQTLGYPSELIGQYEVLREMLNLEYMNAGFLTPKQKIILDAVKKQDVLDFLKAESQKKDEMEVDICRMGCFVCLGIHTHYPFRNEIGDMKMIRRLLYDKMPDAEKKANNWCVLEHGFKQMSFSMTKYKTQKQYGIREMDIVEPYTALIHRLFQLRGIKLADINHQPLLVDGANEPLTKNKLSKVLAEYTTNGLGHPISTTLMAKLFGTSAKDPSHPTPQELLKMKDEADIRGHSIKMRLLKYVG
jgi:hypothetical protein